MIKVILTHDSIKYLVGACVANSDAYRVYFCNSGSGQYLLQVASDMKHNGGLDRAAYVMKELKQASDSYETEFAILHPDKRLSYDKLFPAIHNSFISNEQGGRRINILAFNDIDTIDKMVPLSSLLTKDKLRISLETSGWIMGRLLKLLDFAHRQRISIDIYGNNVLIGPEKHYAVVFDWSTAQTYLDEVPIDVCKQNIANATKAVFTAIGGDIETGSYLYDEGNPYVKLLWSLTKPPSGDAEKAHHDFYEVVDGIFGKGFYPFKAFAL